MEHILKQLGFENWEQATTTSVALPPAISKWSQQRQHVAIIQAHLAARGLPTGKVDGWMGPQTELAIDMLEDPTLWRTGEHQRPVHHTPLSVFPREANVTQFYGRPGEHQARLQLPYPMRLAWNPSKQVRSIMCHEKVCDSIGRVLTRVLDHYGEEGIELHGLDMFGGCLNVRKKRGGSEWSMHSWGIALDFDPARNKLRWNRDRAHLATPACSKFLDLWEEEGWCSLGRARNYDWMHIQAAIT